MKHTLLALFSFLIVTSCYAQDMLGKSTDDILKKYKANARYVLIKLRTPDGVVMPRIKIDHTIDLTKTGKSENTIITYRTSPNNYLLNFILISDKCIQYDVDNDIKTLYQTLDKFNQIYVPIKSDDGLINTEQFYYKSKDDSFKIAVTSYKNEKKYKVSYYYN